MIRRFFWSLLGWRCYAARFVRDDELADVQIWERGSNVVADLVVSEIPLRELGWTRIGCWK
jgi:hypothetical protein